ncbi:MAG: pyrimidine-specific ribonucleoside hydrolase RihA [Spirochaetes bacterium]|nr:MAG: pyrimidine-specific ribonucleoside hydrolase RihA [Spirochaetota bacterium]
MKRKIIIDCDPGIDDALAIFMALASEKLEVLGITTVAGNVGIDHVTRNALSLVSMAGFQIPVCRGAVGPFLMKRETGGARVHGENGVGDVPLPQPSFDEDPRSAADFINEMAGKYEGELELVVIGPLTNIATALGRYPDLSKKIKGLIMMGGAAGFGNVTPAAEFNIYADPHAAAAVFQAGIPIDMYGLDVTNRALITEDEIAALRVTGKAIPVLCCDMLKTYADFYQSVGFSGLALHDPFALACAVDESLADFRECNVEVEIQGELTRGKTVVDVMGVTGKKPNVRVALELDRVRFIQLLSDLLCSYE